ncbi:radical SAM protein [Marinitoga sp. 1135]|uniref:Iron-only hydrogenase maturation rSAM protein HydE n=1 Tax=Marinitoga piezophila (strain DSM 14283 / JCM 11233 / KA3) TaxID=443254 RepID=H2J344_MARPK|nr:[FeFe] hydrogenase H-cluster radical SAM maturase HydE [Marinitoga piezophila]AEX84562.1 iron-only hydrogenase maturation rSAM protein HydE [Marinitoga piezophila KA3]NUU94859.1 radical SAM protein [Marinitoga sp. 1135]NUU96797.1 radical SAM protein [Marinitoga sp. 1138]
MIYISKRFERLIEKLKKIQNDVSSEVSEIINYFLKYFTLDYEKILWILRLENENKKEEIYKVADIVTRTLTTDFITLKGIIEFTNYCNKSCNYCGIRVQNNCIKRYRIPEEEILKIAKNGVDMGLTTIILQGGEDEYFSDETLERIIYKIHHEYKTSVSLSIGERSKEAYKRFKEAGASKVLLKHETINKKIFNEIHPDKDYEYRIELLDYLVYLGYITGSGNIIGLPGQTEKDIADDIIFMRDHRIKMIGMGPFISTHNTPLEGYPDGSADLTLNAYAATRLTIPYALMPATTALGTLKRDYQFKALRSGCNVIMVNITPDKYRKNYNIYDEKIKVEFYETAERILEEGLKLSPYTYRRILEAKRNGYSYERI